jgi:uncharacterized protein
MLVEAEIWTVARTDQGNAVLVRPVGGETAVPIFIGQPEAQSILIGLGNVPMPRPLSHDLFIVIMKKIGLALQRVEITGLKEGTFYAQLILQQGKETLEVDSRPSDAIALAVRVKCPVYIAETVVDEAGISIHTITEESETVTTETSEEEGETEKSKLQHELDEAVAEENYERAAQIRDRLKELESQ